jgi:hypothetical protein
MTAADLNVIDLLERAKAWISKGWMKGSMWDSGTGGREIQSPGDLYDPEKRGKIERVCAVGAMRLAFAEIVEMERGEYETWGSWEQRITRHPLYVEGMTILGRGFWNADVRPAYSDGETLLDGLGGRPYTSIDVENTIIDVNDLYDDEDHQTVKEDIEAAFESALRQAKGEEVVRVPEASR